MRPAGLLLAYAYGNYNNSSRHFPGAQDPRKVDDGLVGTGNSGDEAGSILLPAITEGKGYLVKTEADEDYFLLECRGAERTSGTRRNISTSTEKGSDWGLLIYHVRNEYNSWMGNAVNIVHGNEHYKILYSNPAPGTTTCRSIFRRIVFPAGKMAPPSTATASLTFWPSTARRQWWNSLRSGLDAVDGSVKLSADRAQWQHHGCQDQAYSSTTSS